MESGILFKPEMIRAYLAGRKEQTRRLKNLPEINQEPALWKFTCIDEFRSAWFTRKETFRMFEREKDGRDLILYKADGQLVDPFWWSREDWSEINSSYFDHWTSAVFMPKKFCRFRHIPILNVHCERLLDITKCDALREGVSGRDEFFALWDEINGKKFPVSFNPWVCVYSFQEYRE